MSSSELRRPKMNLTHERRHSCIGRLQLPYRTATRVGQPAVPHWLADASLSPCVPWREAHILNIDQNAVNAHGLVPDSSLTGASRFSDKHHEYDIQERSTRLGAEVTFESSEAQFERLTGLSASQHFIHETLNAVGEAATLERSCRTRGDRSADRRPARADPGAGPCSSCRSTASMPQRGRPAAHDETRPGHLARTSGSNRTRRSLRLASAGTTLGATVQGRARAGVGQVWQVGRVEG
jgi:hypothetical protein